jgi:putative addiction module CopG family antidote
MDGGNPMRSTQQLSITLPHEMAERVRAKVESGEYASESEVIRDGLRALEMHNRALEEWLRNEVVPSIEGVKNNPSLVRNSDQVRASLAEAYKALQRAG